jgi:hypothetical protein
MLCYCETPKHRGGEKVEFPPRPKKKLGQKLVKMNRGPTVTPAPRTNTKR